MSGESERLIPGRRFHFGQADTELPGCRFCDGVNTEFRGSHLLTQEGSCKRERGRLLSGTRQFLETQKCAEEFTW